jgi:hypothetical protein
VIELMSSEFSIIEERKQWPAGAHGETSQEAVQGAA